MNPDENERLIDDLLEGEISEAEFLRLEAELIVSPEAREAYYDRLKLHTGLQEEARSGGAPLPGATSLSTGSGPKKLDPILLTAIGALILAVAFLGWKVVAETPSPQTEPVASGYGVIANLAGASWGPSANLSRGDLIPAEEVTLSSGLAKAELFNGAKLVFDGETTFTLLSETKVQLDRGSIHVQTPIGLDGFFVTTPHGMVECIWPETYVEATPEETRVVVVDGAASWTPKDSDDTIQVSDNASQNSLTWNSDGSHELGAARAISMDELDRAFSENQSFRQTTWQKYREGLLEDKDLIAYYALSSKSGAPSRLQDLTLNSTIGAVVLADQIPDRWNRTRSALDFSPMGSRVRVTVPGEHRSLTLMCWVKIDSLDRLFNSLFLTDGHELHEPHWQIMNDGRLFFSVRATGSGKGKDKHIAYSPPIWTPSQSGQWIHLTSVYDGEAFTITHYVNGKAVSMDQIPESLHPEKVTIGPASIGNWSEPRYRKDAEFAVRNLNGTIDELGLWSRPLAAGEVEEIWAKGRP